MNIYTMRASEFGSPEYVHYTTRRPPPGIGQHCPAGSLELVNTGAIYRRGVLGGLINDYCREVA